MTAEGHAERPKLLTDVELELMSILWRLGEGTVNEVRDELPPERSLAYTSVSTVLRILEKKGLVRSRKVGRGHTYTPTLDKGRYERRALDHVIGTVFDGTPVTLVRRLVESEALSPAEMDEIRSLLRERARK
jgi:predicted transcriptional regulator